MVDRQVMVITGTSRGIGRCLAEYYTKNGFQVIGCSRSPLDCISENYHHFCLDISDEVKSVQMFSEISKTYKRLDILINNAAIASSNYVLLTPLKTIQETLSTNCAGVFLFCREAIKLMKKNHYGRIVNISTIHIPLSTIGSSIYGASKAAVQQFSRVLAREVASYGITVNILGLSFVKDSGMLENISEKTVTQTLEQTILKCCLDIEDVVHAMDFLISPQNRMMTGQTLYLGGI